MNPILSVAQDGIKQGKSQPWHKRKIAILAGGPSCEREISLISGRAVFDALYARGLEVFMLDPVGDFMGELKKQNVSVVFLALHGSFGEDGTVQRMLEEAGIVYTGSGIEASEVAFDKAKTQALLKKAAIKVPEFVVFENKKDAGVKSPLPYPCVIKPTKSGSSVGISIISKDEDYERAVKEAFRYSDSIIVEQYVHGRELTVGILDNKALPVVEVIAARDFYDYQAKYQDTGTRYEFPAKLSEKMASIVSEIALRAYKAVGCEVMARVDIILADDQTPYVLELNTIPGLTGKSLLPKAAKASGIDFPDLCVKIIDLSLGRAEKRLGQKKIGSR